MSGGNLFMPVIRKERKKGMHTFYCANDLEEQTMGSNL